MFHSLTNEKVDDELKNVVGSPCQAKDEGKPPTMTTNEKSLFGSENEEEDSIFDRKVSMEFSPPSPCDESLLDENHKPSERSSSKVTLHAPTEALMENFDEWDDYLSSNSVPTAAKDSRIRSQSEFIADGKLRTRRSRGSFDYERFSGTYAILDDEDDNNSSTSPFRDPLGFFTPPPRIAKHSRAKSTALAPINALSRHRRTNSVSSFVSDKSIFYRPRRIVVDSRDVRRARWTRPSRNYEICARMNHPFSVDDSYFL